ncbi:MAG: peroxiredoxin [Proteobacteria bacterium]|nr:peroxiredoxin [Pseudomonadota bacterium]
MIGIGDRIPEATVYRLGPNGPQPISAREIFAGNKVALFAVPGAYTPTCHNEHLPGYLQNANALQEKGIERIVCVAVNDPFVMDAWGRALGVGDRVLLIADGNAALTTAMGLEIDLAVAGLGVRSRRYSAIVDDGVVTELNIEDDPGAHTICSAAHMLGQL